MAASANISPVNSTLKRRFLPLLPLREAVQSASGARSGGDQHQNWRQAKDASAPAASAARGRQ